MKNFFKKELYVIRHVQTARVRMVKYTIFLVIFWAVYWWGNWEAVRWTLGALLIVALGMHFFFRWKSKDWMEDYGMYKSVFKKKS
jgi:hypothetical protein